MNRLLKSLSVMTLLAFTLLANVAFAQYGNAPPTVNVYFVNQSNATAKVEWINGNSRQLYATVAPGRSEMIQTYIGHQWSFSGQFSGMGGPVTHANQVYTLQAPAQQFQQPVQPLRPQPQPQPVIAISSPLNQAVVNYARSVVGQRIGRGQCTDLASAALQAAGARANQGYNWGNQFNNVRELQPGDIIQMYDARFQGSFGMKWSTGPHTAIVTGVQGNTVQVLEQNISGSPVQMGDYDLSTMTAGRIEFWRPVAGNSRSQIGAPRQWPNQIGGPRPNWIRAIDFLLD